jgi:hypothetical protein
MTAIPLTTPALKGIKRELGRQYPEIKSAHLTEAIAQSLGYRTHAALLPDLDKRPENDPDYAYLDDEQFLRRARELSGGSVDGFDLAFADLESHGAINTFSVGATRVNLRSSLRKQAWRNAMVAGINAGIEQRLFTIRPGDNRWDGWVGEREKNRGATYSFEVDGIPGIGFVSDAGYDELAIHVALWPTAEGERFVEAGNGGLYAGELFASGWLERRKGAWLQVSNDVATGWSFRSRRDRLRTVAVMQVRPHGFAASGSFII